MSIDDGGNLWKSSAPEPGLDPLFQSLTPPYSTIVADPPWPYLDGYSTQSRTVGRWTGPDHRKWLPYSTLTVAEIGRLPVASLAAEHCRLFLWTTNRYLPDAFGIAEDWGFRYRQALVWHKTDGNMGGSVAPCSAEFLLVCVRGVPSRLAKATSAVITHAQAKHHSAKPAAFLDLAEQVSPGPYVELFARQPRLGWDSWGYGYEGQTA